jgi:cytochrome c2
MSVDKRAELGETIIFGKVGGSEERGIGKGQCPLCHTFKAGDIGERAPNLIGIAQRAALRIKEPRYLKPDTVQTEAYPGSGRATTAEEYIAESHACPSCYVVEGFGAKGTNDRESPMNVIHKPPIGLSIDELVAVDTWLFYREGLTPPSPQEIRAAYEKFIPPSDRPILVKTNDSGTGPMPPDKDTVLPSDTPEQIVGKMKCNLCHQIPGMVIARTGVIGPMLIEGRNAVRRIASPEYQAQLKAGIAQARTPKEYIMESIAHPNAFVVPAFVPKNGPHVSPMFPDFGQKLNYLELEKLADHLLTLNCASAKKDGLTGPPQEPVSKVCGY